MDRDPYAPYRPFTRAFGKERGTPACVWLVIAICVMTTSIGCENMVDPFAGTSVPSFAVYGYLDSRADTQFVRVSPVIGASGFEYAESLDAEVILSDVDRNTSIALQDSSTTLEDGRRAYIYYTLATPRAGQMYRLDVYGPNGGDTTTAFTAIPGPDQVVALDAERDIGGRYVQLVQWIGVSAATNIVVDYEVRAGANETSVRVDYPSPTVDQPNETWLSLHWDRDVVLRTLSAEMDTSDVELLSVSITADLASLEWGAVADRPRTFFGAVARVQRAWSLPDSVAAAIGYVVP